MSDVHYASYGDYVMMLIKYVMFSFYVMLIGGDAQHAAQSVSMMSFGIGLGDNYWLSCMCLN